MTVTTEKTVSENLTVILNDKLIIQLENV